MIDVGYRVPGIPPSDPLCVYWQCGQEPAILCWVLSGDADHAGATWNPLCRQHARDVTDKWVREMTVGGPCKSILIVLP